MADNSEDTETASFDKNVSFWWDEDRIQKLDRAITFAKVRDDRVGDGDSRSDVMRLLLSEFIEEYYEGNLKPGTAIVAD